MLPALTLLSSILGSSGTSAVSTSLDATQAAGLAGATTPAAIPTQDFSSVLSDVAGQAVSNLKAAETTATAGLQGHASALQVSEAVSSAQQSLQMALAVRDKVVSAYQEVSRMTI